MTGASLLYVYAVSHAESVATGDIRGIDDQPVRAVSEGDLAAFVSEVPAEEFGEGPLNAHLPDMAWLTPRAVRHQEVNAALASSVDPLAPLSFGTVFHDRDGVRRMLRERAPEVGPTLERLRGKAEWIAVVRRDESVALATLESESSALRGVREAVAAAPPGRAYLIARRLDETKRVELRSTDAEAVAAAVDALGRSGVALFREPLIEDAGAGMIARYSVLAGRGAAADLQSVRDTIAKDWTARGYSLELTGPWPAYRFATTAP